MRSPETGADPTRLELLFGPAPVGLGFWDRELRYVWVNEALAAINGVSVAEHAARPVEELLPDVGPRIAPLLREVLDSGEVLHRLIPGETPARPGVERWFSATYYPVRNEDGEVIGVGA